MKRFSIFLIESFKDAARKWSQEADPETVNNYINQFKKLKDINFLIGEQGDVSRYIKYPFDTFKVYVDGKMKEYELKKKEKESQTAIANDAIKYFENKYVLVVVPKTHEASCKYGAGTKWCITSTGDRYWNSYVHEDGLTPYFVILKQAGLDKFDELLVRDTDRSSKYAVMVDYDARVHSIWDESDHNILGQTLYSFEEEYKDDDGEWQDEKEEPIGTIADIFYNEFEFDVWNLDSMLEEDEPETVYISEIVKNFFDANDDSYWPYIEDMLEFYKENPQDRQLDFDIIQQYIEEFMKEEYISEHGDDAKEVYLDDSDKASLLEQFKNYLLRPLYKPEYDAINQTFTQFMLFMNNAVRVIPDSDQKYAFAK